MTTRAIQASLVALVLAICTGCYQQNKVTLGRLDLSKKGSTCEKRFVWNYNSPEILLVLSDTNGSSRAAGSHPDWSLVIQSDVVDTQTGASAFNSRITREEMSFAKLDLPATCVLFRVVPLQPTVLEADHRYKFMLTVSEAAADAGTAQAYFFWVTGDSL